MCELMGLSFEQPMSADFSIRAFALRDVENADGVHRIALFVSRLPSSATV